MFCSSLVPIHKYIQIFPILKNKNWFPSMPSINNVPNKNGKILESKDNIIIHFSSARGTFSTLIPSPFPPSYFHTRISQQLESSYFMKNIPLLFVRIKYAFWYSAQQGNVLLTIIGLYSTILVSNER